MLLLEIFATRVFFCKAFKCHVNDRSCRMEDRIALFLDDLAVSNAAVFAFIFMQCEEVITISKTYQNAG